MLSEALNRERWSEVNALFAKTTPHSTKTTIQQSTVANLQIRSFLPNKKKTQKKIQNSQNSKDVGRRSIAWRTTRKDGGFRRQRMRPRRSWRRIMDAGEGRAVRGRILGPKEDENKENKDLVVYTYIYYSKGRRNVWRGWPNITVSDSNSANTSLNESPLALYIFQWYITRSKPMGCVYLKFKIH